MSAFEEIRSLRDEVIGLRACLNEAEYRREGSERARDGLAKELDDERISHQETLALLKQTERERDAILHLKDDDVRLRQEIARLQRQVTEIHLSRTWRVGRAILLPVRILRRLTRLTRKS